MGPFKNSGEYYKTYAEQYVTLIADKQTSISISRLIWFAHSAKIVVHQLCSTASQESERYFLKHVDDKDEHLMVHQNLNIVAVIDWQIARTAPANEASSPSLLTAVMNSICNGNFGYSSKDRLLANVLWKREHLSLRRPCLPSRRQDASRGLLRLNRLARTQVVCWRQSS
jgi:hypothetical protein